MAALITDHVFRAAATTTIDVDAGMCRWLGICNQPDAAHAAKRAVTRTRHSGPQFDESTERQIAAAYTAGALLRELSHTYGASPDTIRAAIVRQGVAIRPGNRGRADRMKKAKP